MYNVLKKLKIRNRDFFLRLYDESLLGVDPHSKFLTDLQKKKIYAECCRNPWYYFREVCRLKVPGGQIHFMLHRGNLAQLFCCLNSINFLMMLPRQAGKTQGMVAALNYIAEFVNTNTDITLGNKKFSDSKLNLSRFRDQRELIPSYLTTESPNDINNIEKIELSNRDITLEALPAGNSLDHAEGLGRGLTYKIRHFVGSRKTHLIAGISV